MESKFYLATDLDILMSMLEPALQERKKFTAFKGEILRDHPWLSPVMGPLSEEENFIETSNHGKVQTKLASLPIATGEIFQALMLEITLPARCIMKDGKPEWGAFVPNHFHFSQVRPGQYALTSMKTPYYEKTHPTGAESHS